MSSADSQLLHAYRKPIYQKRLAGADNYISMPHVHASVPKRTVLVSRRRHSTPQAATLRFVEVKSPQSNAIIKHYYVNTKSARGIKELSPKSESVKSPTRPASLVKPRNQDERVVRLATTPTSMTSSTDIFLPIAKRNRTTIVETPSSVASDIQSINYNVATKKQSKKRDRTFSFDLGQDFFGSDEESSQDDASRPKMRKCCPVKCHCGLPHCNFHECYYSCPFGCWITCFLLAIALLIGIFISIRFASH